MTAKTILCVGYAAWDTVLHAPAIPDPDFSETLTGDHESSGGSAANTALALASLGHPVGILSSIAADDEGDNVRNHLTNHGVTPYLQRNTDTTTTVFAIITDDADPRYLAKGQTFGDFDASAVPTEEWDDIDHVHVTSFDSDIASAIATTSSEDGKTVSFNPSQGYNRNRFDDVVAAADVIFLNEREASIFRDRHNFGETTSEKCLIITQGSSGATAYTPTGVHHSMGANIADIKDTIGAGDCFTAGFLSAWLNAPQDYEAALANGNNCGAYAVTTVGSPDTLDTDWINKQQTIKK